MQPEPKAPTLSGEMCLDALLVNCTPNRSSPCSDDVSDTALPFGLEWWGHGTRSPVQRAKNCTCLMGRAYGNLVPLKIKLSCVSLSMCCSTADHAAPSRRSAPLARCSRHPCKPCKSHIFHKIGDTREHWRPANFVEQRFPPECWCRRPAVVQPTVSCMSPHRLAVSPQTGVTLAKTAPVTSMLPVLHLSHASNINSRSLVQCICPLTPCLATNAQKGLELSPFVL